MIQDIEPKVYNNHYFPEKKPSAASYVIFYDERRIYCSTEGGELALPRLGEIGDVSGEFTYLFSIDGDEFYLASASAPAREGWDYAPLFAIQRLKPQHLAFAAMEAYSLAGWYSSNRFCGHCGGKMAHSETERALQCPACGNLIYPKICPVVIVGVRSGDKLLLTKYKGRPEVPFFALVAGFAEIGERIEDTVRREVMEETGMVAREISFNRSKYFERSNTLMLNWTVYVEDASKLKPNWEVDSCSWFTFEEARANIKPGSLAEWFLDCWLDSQK